MIFATFAQGKLLNQRARKHCIAVWLHKNINKHKQAVLKTTEIRQAINKSVPVSFILVDYFT